MDDRRAKNPYSPPAATPSKSQSDREAWTQVALIFLAVSGGVLVSLLVFFLATMVVNVVAWNLGVDQLRPPSMADPRAGSAHAVAQRMIVFLSILSGVLCGLAVVVWKTNRRKRRQSSR